MAKINHEEYEILKGLDEKWKWIARDSGSVLSDTLWIYEHVPERAQSYWMEGWGEYKELPYRLFRFVQWEDNEPYRIAELIEEYENEESEAKILESDYDKVIDELTRYVDQLEDEPEVLSQEDNINIVLDDLKEHIKEQQSLSQNVGMAHTPAGNDTHYRQYDYVLECINEYEPSDDLQNLLMPKQELPVIPKFVADYLDFAKSDVPLMRVMELANTRNEWSKWEKEYDWISANDETFARAWLDGFTVANEEEEPKYHALIKGHENIVSDDKYWNYCITDESLDIGDNKVHTDVLAEYVLSATKDDWENLGISDDNADFVKVEEMEE